MSLDPFEAAEQRYKQAQELEQQRLAELRGVLGRHGIEINSHQFSGYGIRGRFWYAKIPSGHFYGVLHLRTRAIERYVTTGDPPVRAVARIVLTLVDRFLDALHETIEKQRREGEIPPPDSENSER